MHPTLIFIHGPLAGKRISLDGEKTLGRAPSNDVELPDPLVSRTHAVILERGGSLVLEDLGSHNGTYVNDERIHQIRRLRHGDRLALGASKILFEDPREALEDITQVAEAAVFAGSAFTQRQLQVITLMARGLSNKEIGARLYVSERTAKAYVSSIFEKLGVNKRASAVAEAMRLGLIGQTSGDDEV